MLVEIFFALVIGVFFGTLTGITPGLHINLLATILLSVSGYLLGYFSVVSLAVFIISMSVTHTFVDFIAAIYLGAPGDDTALSVLPGHRMLLRGMGHEAVKLTVVGSFGGLIVVSLFVPVLLRVVPFMFERMKNDIGWFLLVIVGVMLFRDKGVEKKFWNVFIFLLSGVFGVFVFNLPGVKDPLLPMFSGMFGISVLLTSLFEHVEIPIQRATEMVHVSLVDIIKSLSSGSLSGMFVSLFPGLGPAQAAVIGMQFVRGLKVHSTLILLGAINTVSMILSLITMLTIDKARNGSIIVVQKLMGSLDMNLFLVFLFSAIVSGCIACFVALFMSRVFSFIVGRIHYNIISLCVIFFVIGLVTYFSSFLGLIVLVVGTCIGLVPGLVGSNKSHLMGCLLLPVMLFYFL